VKQTVAALLFALAGALPLAAQQRIPPASSVMPPGYLQAMPTVDRVLADMKVADSVQTRARQYAAVSDLGHILDVLTVDHQFRPGLTVEEGRLQRGYLDAENQLRYRSALVPGLMALMDRYSGENAPFRSEFLDRYFSPAWKTAFLTLDAQYHERIRALAAANAAPRAEAPAPAPPVPATTLGAQAARRGPPAFDTSLVRLRPQYPGDDLAAIYRAFGQPKDTFETTAQFQRRVANAPSPRPFAFLLPDESNVGSSFEALLGVSFGVSMEYNADAAELTVHLQVECFGEANGSGNMGKLSARSSGARPWKDYRLLVSCPEGEFDPYPVHLEPGAARRASAHISAVLVGVPALLWEGGYTRVRETHLLHITPLSLWIFNTSTGDVLNKHPFTEVRR
jgi:hypothetical protein